MRKIIAFGALTALVTALALPAHAAGTSWNGSVGTGCTTRLKDFPTTNPNVDNPDNCDSDNGTTPTGGNPLDYAVGVIHTGAGDFVASGQNGTRVDFAYSENCGSVPDAQFPSFGSSQGDFLVSGTFNNAPATLLAGYKYDRTGLVASIVFNPTVGERITDAQTPGGQIRVLSNLYGINTVGTVVQGVPALRTFASVQQSSPAGTTAQAVGLLIPQAGGGNADSTTGQVSSRHHIGGDSSLPEAPGNTCPDDNGDSNWEVVTVLSQSAISG